MKKIEEALMNRVNKNRDNKKDTKKEARKFISRKLSFLSEEDKKNFSEFVLLKVDFKKAMKDLPLFEKLLLNGVKDGFKIPFADDKDQPWEVKEANRILSLIQKREEAESIASYGFLDVVFFTNENGEKIEVNSKDEFYESEYSIHIEFFGVKLIRNGELEISKDYFEDNLLGILYCEEFQGGIFEYTFVPNKQ